MMLISFKNFMGLASIQITRAATRLRQLIPDAGFLGGWLKEWIKCGPRLHAEPLRKQGELSAFYARASPADPAAHRSVEDKGGRRPKDGDPGDEEQVATG
ncbi:MAG: hypothetical protein AAF360_06455 [Pseudomonadota bacterium]